MKKIHKIIGVASVISMPAFALAQTLETVMGTITDVINVLVPLLIAIAIVLFVWGVVQFVGAAGDEEKRAAGRQLMIWGIIGLAVIIAVWGLVNVLLQTFNLNVSAPPTPIIPGP